MPLYDSFELDKNKSFHIWEIRESYQELEKEVNLSLNDKKKLEFITSLQRKKEFLAARNLFSFAKLQNKSLKY